MSRNSVPGADTVNSVGDTIAAHTPDAVAGNNPTGNLANDIKTGSWSSVPASSYTLATLQPRWSATATKASRWFSVHPQIDRRSHPRIPKSIVIRMGQ